MVARGLHVVFSRFVLSFFNLGVYKTLGVFYSFFISDLDSSSTIVGFSCSVYAGLGNALGSFTMLFEGILSCRQMVILGGVLSVAGLAVCSVSPTIHYLILGMSVAGIGQAFTQVQSIGPLMWYFPHSFATVNGISLAGGAIGMMILPPATERLILAYGWRGAMAIIAVFSMHAVAAGAILKQPQWAKNDRKPNKCFVEDEYDFRNCLTIFKDKLNIMLFIKYPAFSMFQFVFLLNGVLSVTWVVFLVPHAMLKGLCLSEAVWLSSAGGVGAIFGRICNGILIDCKLMSEVHLFLLVMVTLSMSFILDVVANTFGSLAILSCRPTVGVCVGAQYPLAMGESSDTVVYCRCMCRCAVSTGNGTLQNEDRNALSAIAWTYLFTGTGNTIAGPLVGWLSEVTGDFTVVFEGLGVVHILVCLLTVCYDWRRRRSQYSSF